MSKKWILILDSGLGALNVLKELQNVMPNENYLVFMDKIHCPYGNKPKAKLIKISENIIDKLTKKFKIKLVVVACNTLSSVAGEHLQKKFLNLPFVFVVPNTSKEIFEHKTLILATKNTVKYNLAIKSAKTNKNVYICGFGKLAKMIEDCNQNFDLLKGYLNKKLRRYKSKKIENVVLGCTHFNYIKPQIESALQSRLNFFENSENVALQAKIMLKANSDICRSKHSGEVLKFYKVT